MLINKDSLYSLVDSFPRFPGEIKSLTCGSFETVFGGLEAAVAKDIIYFYLTSLPVPRLNGKSRVLYIGQTKQSFKARYLQQATVLCSTQANTLKYKTVFDKYGPIEIAYCDYKRFGKTIKEAEGQFLWWYFQNHSEYPPFNYTKTSVRIEALDCIQI